MKVITLTEPWATLVVIGAKQFETRSWARPPQGRILVHAAKAMPPEARDLVMESGPIQHALCEHFGNGRLSVLGLLDNRRGKIIGSVTHVACWHTEQLRGRLDEWERAFGDYSDRRYGWELAQPTAYHTHIPARGMLGIWQLPRELEDAVHAAAAEVRTLEVRP